MSQRTSNRSPYAEAMLALNVAEVRRLARALRRRAARVTPSGAAAAVARAATDLAVFPATLAASLGTALIPGGWMHGAVAVATAEIVSYPAAVVAGVAAAARRLATQAARLDAKGIYADVVREFVEFPTLLYAAVAPFLQDFAPLGSILAELFVGKA